MVGANNFIMAPYCWIARFTPGNVLPVARDLPISHIYGIKIPVATPLRCYTYSRTYSGVYRATYVWHIVEIQAV